MDSERTLPDYSVVVEGGKITTVAPTASITVPRGATVIDGRGKFLMPGLADMHMHIDRKTMLPLFLAAGVTTTLNMGLASPEFVSRTRFEVAAGAVPGPQIFAAFLMDGPGDPGPEYVAPCPSDARVAVDRARLVGYDFIKVYSRLQSDIYAAIIDEARQLHMPVVGHLPTAVGLEKSLSSGQVMIAHGEEFYKTFFGEKPDTKLIPEAVKLTHDAGAYVTPNLSFFSSLTARTADPSVADQQLAAPEARLVPPDIRGGWVRRASKGSDRFVAEYHLLQQLTLAMANGGVPLLTGSDTPAGGMVPGFSLPDDLAELVRAGLTPYQALTAATRTPGEFIRKFVPNADDFGTIATGKRADLVLLSANPLVDVTNVRHPIGVMAAGRWYDARELKVLVDQPVPEYDRITALESRFKETLVRSGAKAAIAEFTARPAQRDLLTENFLNSLGYQSIAAKKLGDAMGIFVLCTDLYPNSWNAYDSLAEAYSDANNRDLAILNYRRSLAINPHNAGAEAALKRAAKE